MADFSCEEPLFDRSRDLVQLIMSYAFDHVEEVNDYARNLGKGKIVVERGREDYGEVAEKEIEPLIREEVDSLWGALLDLVDGIQAQHDSEGPEELPGNTDASIKAAAVSK